MNSRAKSRYFTIKEAATYLRVSPGTLRNWDHQGILSPFRTPGGQRRYTLHQLEECLLSPTEAPSTHQQMTNHSNSAPIRHKPRPPVAL